MASNVKALIVTFLLAAAFTWWGLKQVLEAYEDNGPLDFAADAIVPAAVCWLVFAAVLVKTRRDGARARMGRRWHQDPHER